MKLNHFSYLFFIVLAASISNTCYGTSIRLNSDSLTLRENTTEATAYQLQFSADLEIWENIGNPLRGNGVIAQFEIPNPEANSPSVFYRIEQSKIWAPIEVGLATIKQIIEYTEADGRLEFDGESKSNLLLIFSEVVDGELIDATIHSTANWTIDPNNFNHVTLTVSATKIEYRSPIQGSFDLAEIALMTGEDPPEKGVYELYYTGNRKGSYTSHFYLLSGTLDEQDSGLIETLLINDNS